MKTLTFCVLGILCLSLSACHEKEMSHQETGEEQLGAFVYQILEEENLDEAIWNPEGINAQDLPAIRVENEDQLRDLIKELSVKAQKFGQTIEHVNQVNHRRFNEFQQNLKTCSNRKDSLKVAMAFPEIIYIRDTLELIELGLIKKQ